jgi:hypothetical protein
LIFDSICLVLNKFYIVGLEFWYGHTTEDMVSALFKTKRIGLTLLKGVGYMSSTYSKPKVTRIKSTHDDILIDLY